MMIVGAPSCMTHRCTHTVIWYLGIWVLGDPPSRHQLSSLSLRTSLGRRASGTRPCGLKVFPPLLARLSSPVDRVGFSAAPPPRAIPPRRGLRPLRFLAWLGTECRPFGSGPQVCEGNVSWTLLSLSAHYPVSYVSRFRLTTLLRRHPAGTRSE